LFLRVQTHSSQEIVNITNLVLDAFASMHLSRDKGFVVLYNPHTTSALLINEGSDSSVAQDILTFLNKNIPLHDNYAHDSVDNNAHAHIKSSLFPSHLMIPFSKGSLLLGVWQGVFLLEFDGPRTRKIYMDVLYS